MQAKIEIAAKWRWCTVGKLDVVWLFTHKPRCKGLLWEKTEGDCINISGLTIMKITGLWARRTFNTWQRVG